MTPSIPITFEVATEGLLRYAETLGGAGPRIGAAIADTLPKLDAQLGPDDRVKLRTLITEFYSTQIIGKFAAAIQAKRGVVLPGYVPVAAPAAPEVETLTDEQLLGILRPLYKQFQEAAAGA